MAFKLNNPPYRRLTPVYHVDMEDDVLGKANNNLTIIINKNVKPEMLMMLQLMKKFILTK